MCVCVRMHMRMYTESIPLKVNIFEIMQKIYHSVFLIMWFIGIFLRTEKEIHIETCIYILFILLI